MTKRLFIFLALAVCVWSFVSLFGNEKSSDTIRSVVGFVAFFSVSGSCVSLAVQKRLQEKFGELGGYLGSLAGRTVVPLVATLAALICCEDNIRREVAFRVLLGYFGTAPFHIWASIPDEKEVVKRVKARNAFLDRCKNGSYED